MVYFPHHLATLWILLYYIFWDYDIITSFSPFPFAFTNPSHVPSLSHSLSKLWPVFLCCYIEHWSQEPGRRQQLLPCIKHAFHDSNELDSLPTLFNIIITLENTGFCPILRLLHTIDSFCGILHFKSYICMLAELIHTSIWI